MATIQLTTTNYSGESANVWFFPCNSGGTNTNLGEMTFPTEIVDTENYEGTYEVEFTGLTSGNPQFCYVQIPCSGCNRPTGLTQTDLWITYSPDNENEINFTGSAIDACNALVDIIDNSKQLTGYLFSQIGPDNTVYKTIILGDCATISDGFYILIEDGVKVVREISGGILSSSIINCYDVLYTTPTPTPTVDLPTVTPTPTATATPTPEPTSTPTPPQTYSIQIAAGIGGPSGTACQNAQLLNFNNTVYSLLNNGGQLSTSTETLYNDMNATSEFNGNFDVYSDGTVYGTISTSGVFAFQGYCSGI